MDYRRPQEIRSYAAPGRERLERLAAFVERLPPGKLTFSRWYGHGRGCAVGLAAVGEPWFLAQGLRLERADSLKDCRPRYREASDWAAVAAFFDLSPTEARELFDREGYDGRIRPTPQEVAGKIRRFLAKIGAETVYA